MVTGNMMIIMPPINLTVLMLGGHQGIVYLLRWIFDCTALIKACAIIITNHQFLLPADIPIYHQAGSQEPCTGRKE